MTDRVSYTSSYFYPTFSPATVPSVVTVSTESQPTTKRTTPSSTRLVRYD